MKRIKLSLILFLHITLLFAQKSFSFVFLPDLHLRTDSAVMASFGRVSEKINKLKQDFVLTGGDMIYTAKNTDDKKATLYLRRIDSLWY